MPFPAIPLACSPVSSATSGCLLLDAPISISCPPTLHPHAPLRLTRSRTTRSIHRKHKPLSFVSPAFTILHPLDDWRVRDGPGYDDDDGDRSQWSSWAATTTPSRHRLSTLADSAVSGTHLRCLDAATNLRERRHLSSSLELSVGSCDLISHQNSYNQFNSGHQPISFSLAAQHSS